MATRSTAGDKIPDDITEMTGDERLSTQAIAGIRTWAHDRIRAERSGRIPAQNVIDVLLDLLSRIRGL